MEHPLTLSNWHVVVQNETLTTWISCGDQSSHHVQVRLSFHVFPLVATLPALGGKLWGVSILMHLMHQLM